jgi:predicted  nucleic acid-binding Zn-ribbon protein
MASATSKTKKTTKVIVKPAANTKVKTKEPVKVGIKSKSNGTITKSHKSKESDAVISHSHTQNNSNVSLSKIAKAKLKPKEPITFKPRKIEKIIDVNRLEKKLEEIMAMDHEEFTVEEKLKALYVLQEIDSNIDKIRTIRGELPMEVTDLEDEIAGLTTRIQNIQDEIAHLNDQIGKKKLVGKDAKEQIKKYEGQQSKVKNNREFDSLNKEIEFQNLEIQLADKRSKEYSTDVSTKQIILDETQAVLEERQAVLKLKKSELETIVEETRKEEDQLHKISAKARTIIDDRLLAAYSRVRGNARNGLGVVAIQRDACGGCFNKIPPQRQLDIRQHKKVIVCEHCGRILVDPKIAEEETAE